MNNPFRSSPVESHEHDRGLQHDLQAMAKQVSDRRHMLGLLTGLGGSLLVPGCGGGGSGSESSALSATTTTGSTAATTTGSTTTTSTGTTATTASTTTSSTTTATTSTTTCVADPTETAGPYPADGTNTVNGSISNVLVVSGIVRSNIRTSFGTSTTAAAGLPLSLTVTLVNTNASCAVLAGYAIYLWHCNAAGKYSLYDLPAENYLRGVQATDSLGQVTFLTNFPAAYSGRYPHIHFEVYRSVNTATQGSNALLTSQMCMPRDIATSVYSTNSTLYAGSTANLAKITIANDNVFGDNTAAQIAAQTPSLSGSASQGYTGSIVVGLAI